MKSSFCKYFSASGGLHDNKEWIKMATAVILRIFAQRQMDKQKALIKSSYIYKKKDKELTETLATAWARTSGPPTMSRVSYSCSYTYGAGEQ